MNLEGQSKAKSTGLKHLLEADPLCLYSESPDICCDRVTHTSPRSVSTNPPSDTCPLRLSRVSGSRMRWRLPWRRNGRARIDGRCCFRLRSTMPLRIRTVPGHARLNVLAMSETSPSGKSTTHIRRLSTAYC